MDQENEEATEELSLISSTSLLESRTGQLDDLLIEKLERAFHKQTSQVMFHELAKIAIEYDPIDLAHAMNRLPSSVRHIIYENLPDMHAKMIFMINVSSNTRIAILRQISDDEIKKLIEKMPPDEAVYVLEDLSERRVRRVVDMMDVKKAVKIRELQKHGRDTAGRIMTNEYFAFDLNTSIAQVEANIRDNPGIDFTESIFVLNDEKELIGFVPARNLLVNLPTTPIRQVMKPVLHKIYPESSRDEVVDIVERYHMPNLPVVDFSDRLVGVITYEDVLELIKDIADETIASIGGTTAEDISEVEPIFKRFIWRAPWLVVSLCAGLVTATGISHFHIEHWFAVVALFLPLIQTLSGNVGIQCSTIFVRGIATGEITVGSKRDLVRRELTIGLMISFSFGLLCGAIIILLHGLGIHQYRESPLMVASMVACGVFGACTTATFFGTLSPLFFARMRIDPAVASGPIVTACTDVIAAFMYFFIAQVIVFFFGH